MKNFSESLKANSAKIDATNSDDFYTNNTAATKLTYNTFSQSSSSQGNLLESNLSQVNAPDNNMRMRELSQKDLKQYSNQELTQRLEKLVRTERKITNLVLLHIAELEERKVYADLGYDGMYSYLTRGLGYSEGSAYRRLQAARLLRQLPTVSEKVESGAINLSQLTLLQKSIKVNSQRGETVSQEKTLEVLSKLENQNTFETQKTLAHEMNLPMQFHEKIKPQQDDSVRLELTLSKNQFAELELAKSLLSHICPEGSWADVIEALAKSFNQRKLGENSKLSGHQKITKSLSDSDRNPKYRKYISVQYKRRLLRNANYCCEYTDRTTGTRCSSKYQLEVDHIQPLALGGTDDLRNLRILCRTHNALAARRAGVADCGPKKSDGNKF